MPSTKVAPAQRTTKKIRSVTGAGEPVLAGTLFRGSHVVPDCVKQRDAVLFKDKFGTYDRNGKPEKRKQRRLDKVWVLAEHHKLTPIKRRKFSTLENNKRHSLLSALTSDHYVERELYTFALKSEVATKKGSKVLVEKMDLAFDENEDAVRWRQALAEQEACTDAHADPLDIGAIGRNERPSMDTGASPDTAQTSEELPATPGMAESRPANGNGISHSSDDGSHTGQTHNTDDMATPPDTPHAALTTDDDEQDELASLAARTSSIDALQRELGMDARIGQSLDDWKVVTCESSITVLRGTEQHNASSIMLSYIIRAPPRLCVKTLLNRNEQKLKVDSINLTFKVVEIVDQFNDMLETTWLPRGLDRFFIAPRTLRVRRLWRRDDDGTYVVMFRACDPEESETQSSWWQWFAPVSCKLIDTCYTFSPLTNEYSRRRESGETLVTQVSCYGDMGGWLGQGHPMRRVLDLLTPLSGDSTWAKFIQPHIESSIAIRNRAESDRFCSRPFLESHTEGTAAASSALRTHSSSLRSVASSGLHPPQSSFAVSAEGSPRSQTGSATFEDGEEGGPTNSLPPDATPADVATCDQKYWSCPGANNLKVRGANYLKDRKKIPAAEPLFSLAATDLLQVEKPTLHIARFLPSFKASKAPFTFIMQIMFGNPSLSLTFSWAAPEHFMPITQELAAQDLAARSGSGTSVGGVPLSTPSGSLGEDYDLLNKPFELTLARFLAGGTNDQEANQRRNGVLKLIPRISQGAWFVKQAVGTTPCLLGRKLTMHYHRGPRYFEVDLDVSSSSVAANIVGLVQGLTKSLCVDMAIVLEGHSPQELPESLLGTVRCTHLDLGSAKLLNVDTGEITDKPGKGKDAGILGKRQTAPSLNAQQSAASSVAPRNPLRQAVSCQR